MKTTDLVEQIDKLVRDHLAQVHKEATVALERAFASSSTLAPRTKAPTRTRKSAKRRDPALVAEIAERLHERVLAEPGESMVVYAKHLGTGVRELHRPMTLLKQSGRLRTTGVRNKTRYFPMPT